MTVTRPRLVLLPGDSPLEAEVLDWLEKEFEVVRVEDPATLRDAASEHGTLIVCTPERIQELAGNLPPDSAADVLQKVGEGVGVVDASGTLTWTNARLAEYDDDVRRRFAELGREAVAHYNDKSRLSVPLKQRPSVKYTFHCGDRHFELVASPASAVAGDPARAVDVVGVLWDVTDSRRLLDKLDAIDAAGSELMKIEAESIATLSMADRLKLLEEKITHYVRELLNFDNFEIRLLDPKSNRLELVMTVGITPLRIGEVMYAEPEGQGISAHVATTGESYLCADVQADARYREGLDDAGSSLTVPLRLHDRTIGVFNVESKRRGAFDENDRQFATIFGRYIAMAMNILNLLVVERFTTNEELAGRVLGELSDPLEDITKQAMALREEKLADGKTRKGLDEIIEAVSRIHRRIELCKAGPRTILGAEQELHREKPDPDMIGKRVLVADDDVEIRSSICAILAQRGCDVTVCQDGKETIEMILRREAGPAYDLIISDIKMPDRSGYEVFRAAKDASPTTPVILMTGFGYDPHHSIVRASQEGLQSFLFKPFRAQQLVDEVKKALALGDPGAQ